MKYILSQKKKKLNHLIYLLLTLILSTYNHFFPVKFIKTFIKHSLKAPKEYI